MGKKAGRAVTCSKEKVGVNKDLSRILYDLAALMTRNNREAHRGGEPTVCVGRGALPIILPQNLTLCDLCVRYDRCLFRTVFNKFFLIIKMFVCFWKGKF